MNTIEEYFVSIRQLIQGIPEAHTEKHEEQLLSATRGNLRVRLRFSDQALLAISEAIVFLPESLQWLSYRYHYQDPSAALVFRYDNAPHHQEVATYPAHRHSGDLILASVHPSLGHVLAEVLAIRKRGGNLDE